MWHKLSQSQAVLHRLDQSRAVLQRLSQSQAVLHRFSQSQAVLLRLSYHKSCSIDTVGVVVRKWCFSIVQAIVCSLQTFTITNTFYCSGTSGEGSGRIHLGVEGRDFTFSGSFYHPLPYHPF